MPEEPSPQTAGASQHRRSRRSLVRLGWIAAGLLFFGSQLWIFLKLFLRPKTPSGFGHPVIVGPVQRFAVGSVTHFWQARFLLIRHPARFLALSHQCTHSTCQVDFLPAQRVIFCPCHGSRFSLTGEVLAGPAPRPLDRFAVTLRDGQVTVDTSRPLRSRSPL